MKGFGKGASVLDYKDFLGRGWSFPVAVDAVTGRIRTVEYEEDIAQAVRLILLTQKGERVMRPDFGCDAGCYAFHELSATTLTLIEEDVREALIMNEQRITDIQVQAEAEDIFSGKLLMHISYTVRVTNSPYNLVYPYYLNEGMG